MKAMLVTYVNSSNIGDQLIASSFERMLENKVDIIKFDYSLKTLEPKLNTTNIKEPDKKNLLKEFYGRFIRELYLVDNLHRIINSKRIKNNPDWEIYKKELEKCDVLVIGGGNAIFDTTPQSRAAYFFDLHIEMAKKLGKKIFVVSIGIGPFVTDEQIEYTRKTLEKCDYVTFRDKKSLAYMQSTDFNSSKMHLSIDPVFALENVIEYNAKKNKIGICIIDYRLTRAREEDYTKYKRDLVNLINKIKTNSKCSIELFSTELVDYVTVNEIYEMLESKEFVNIREVNSYNDLINLYSELNLIIGTRMHSMIIGVSQYIPVIGLSWQQKVDEMFGILEDESSVFEIDLIAENQEQIICKMNHKIENYEKERRKLISFKEIAHEKFNINHSLINTLIDIEE